MSRNRRFPRLLGFKGHPLSSVLCALVHIIKSPPVSATGQSQTATPYILFAQHPSKVAFRGHPSPDTEGDFLSF